MCPRQSEQGLAVDAPPGISQLRRLRQTFEVFRVGEGAEFGLSLRSTAMRNSGYPGREWKDSEEADTC
jgi:hypothetical protein